MGHRDGAAQTATCRELNSLLVSSQSQFFPLRAWFPDASIVLQSVISQPLLPTPVGLDPVFQSLPCHSLCPCPPKSHPSSLQLNNFDTSACLPSPPFLKIDLRDQFIVALIYASIDCFLYVPWSGLKPKPWRIRTTLTNRATLPGLPLRVLFCFFFNVFY